MDNDGPKDGGTGQIGSKHSTDAAACQTTQDGIPAWMVARNNSVHAPVIGQPSARKSTSRKLPSISTSTFMPETMQPIFAQSTNETKASPPPSQSFPSVGLDTLDDDQALALLLRNETVAGLLQNAFNTRVEEHQQKLDRAYNQRLLELEEYTRSWRDATKELWSAISEGTFKPNNDQKQVLLWKGPLAVGRGLNPEHPAAPQEIVEKEFDPDGRVSCISIKGPGPSHNVLKVACQEWIKDSQGRDSSFDSLRLEFYTIAGVHFDERLVFRTKDKSRGIEYRPFEAVHTIETEFTNKHDVFIELSPENIRILGKAFCYIKERRDQCFRQFLPATDFGIGPGNARRFYNYFLAKPTPKQLHVLFISKIRKKRLASLHREIAELAQVSKRLLIARPCFKKDGKIDAATFLDVGRDMRTTRGKNEEAIVLFEDRTTHDRIAQLLEFSLSLGILPDFNLSMTSITSRENGQEHASQELNTSARPSSNELNASESTVDASISQQSNQSSGTTIRAEISAMWQGWAMDIRGTADDFISKPSKGPAELRSPHSSFHDFASLMEAPPICGRVYFRSTGFRQKYEYFSWTRTSPKVNTVLKTLDIIIELSVQNVLLFWKAFCILKDREDCLFSRSVGSWSGVSKRAVDDSYERLVKRYYDFSLFKKVGATMIQSVSLPCKRSNAATHVVCEGQAEGKHIDRRLVIARPYSLNQRVVGAELFDVGTNNRTGRVPSDIILLEDTATLQGIGRLLEHALLNDIFPPIQQDYGFSAKAPLPTDTSQSMSRARKSPPHDSVAEELEPDKAFGVPRITQEPSPKPGDTKIGEHGRSTSPKRSTPSQASLFQRTIALSDGLKKLNGATCHDSPHTQNQRRGLAMGGEPEEVRSLSPPPEQDTPAISRRLAHRVEAEIPPVSPACQENAELASDDSRSSDLIMLDGQPNSPIAQQCEKHSLSPNDQRNPAKRLRFSVTGSSVYHAVKPSRNVSHALTLPAPELMPSMRAEEIAQNHLDALRADPNGSQGDLEYTSDNIDFNKLMKKTMRKKSEIDLFERRVHTHLAREAEEAPKTEDSKHQVLTPTVLRAQSLPVDEQESIVAFKALPPPSTFTARELQKLRKQLQELEPRLQESVDQVDGSTRDGEIQKMEQLRLDIKRFGGVLEAQRRIEQRKEVSKTLRPGAYPPSHDVSHQPKASSNFSISLFAEPKGARDAQEILAEETKSPPMEGKNLFSSFEEINGLEASAAPKQSCRTIPTEPRALRGVPTEPRAMRAATPRLQHSYWQSPAGPRATSVGPISQHQASLGEASSNTAP